MVRPATGCLLVTYAACRSPLTRPPRQPVDGGDVADRPVALGHHGWRRRCRARSSCSSPRRRRRGPRARGSSGPRFGCAWLIPPFNAVWRRSRLTPSSVVEAGGGRYQGNERAEDHVELLHVVDGDDSEHHHRLQCGDEQSQQRDEQVGDCPASRVVQRLRVMVSRRAAKPERRACPAPAAGPLPLLQGRPFVRPAGLLPPGRRYPRLARSAEDRRGRLPVLRN